MLLNVAQRAMAATLPLVPLSEVRQQAGYPVASAVFFAVELLDRRGPLRFEAVFTIWNASMRSVRT